MVLNFLMVCDNYGKFYSSPQYPDKFSIPLQNEPQRLTILSYQYTKCLQQLNNMRMGMGEGDHVDLGLMSKSKMAVGMERVQQALGMSTMDAILPSTGAQPSRMQACSPVQPRVFRQLMALRQACLYATVASRQYCLPCSSTEIPSKVTHSVQCGPIGPGRKIGFLTAIFFMPPLITFAFISKQPAISMAPQKEISPSPWQKWMSPADNIPPFTYTGRKTLDPMDRFLISQFPPCSLGGMERAPSFLTRSAASPLSRPTTAPLSVGSLASAGTRWGSVSNSSFSRLFHSFSNSWEGAVPMIPG